MPSRPSAPTSPGATPGVIRLARLLLAIVLPAAVLSAVILAAPLSAQQEKKRSAPSGEPIRLGFAGATAGELASYGLSNLYGLEFAVNQINERGGLLGRRVELVEADDGCDPRQAGTAASKLLEAGATIVFGHTCSGATRVALEVYGEKAIVISSSATETSLTEDGLHRYFFRTSPRDDAQVAAQIDHVRRRGFTRVAILHDNGDYGSALAGRALELIKSAPRGIEIVLYGGVPSAEASYHQIVSLIRSNQAQVLIWGGYYADASKLAVQMREGRLDTIIIGPDGIYNPGFLAMAGKAAEGSLATAPKDLGGRPAALAAIADHHSRHSAEIGPYFLQAAAAAQALFAAVEKVGDATDLEAIKRRLTEDTVNTVIGPIRFDSKGDVIGVPFAIYEVRGGEFVEILY